MDYCVLGASSAFIESTLGQIFKRVENNEYRGGPAYYIEYGIGGKFGKIYGIIFAIVTIISVGLLLPGVQSNAIASSMHNAIHVPQWLMGGIVVVILGLIIFVVYVVLPMLQQQLYHLWQLFTY